jgi:hypothetical protein
MLGLINFLVLVAASLLLFGGLLALDWGQGANALYIKEAVEMLLQGKQNVFSLFDRFPWFASATANETEIEAGVVVSGILCLAIVGRLSISELFGKLIFTVIFLGVIFTLAGPGRQAITNLGGSLSSQIGGLPIPQIGAPATMPQAPSYLTKAQCMQLIAQIEFMNQMMQRPTGARLAPELETQIPPIRQAFSDYNCERYGLALP